jgi:hypothetical protein
MLSRHTHTHARTHARLLTVHAVAVLDAAAYVEVSSLAAMGELVFVQKAPQKKRQWKKKQKAQK